LAGVAIAAALAMVPDWTPWSTPKPDVLSAALYDKLATAPRLSIVVLPFESLASDPDQQNFADAFTDDLTAEVSQLKDSFVIGRDSASPYKERPVDAREIGGGLGVRYLLEGSASRVAGAIRVSAQLISTETGAQVGRTGLRARPPRSAKCRRTSSLASPICLARKSSRLKARRRCANSL
jgi:TolB-like protein